MMAGLTNNSDVCRAAEAFKRSLVASQIAFLGCNRPAITVVTT